LELTPTIEGEATVKITKRELESLTEIKPRRSEFYVQQGLYDDLQIAGRGSPTLFKERHVVETYLINEMRNWSIELARIKTIISMLRFDKRFLALFNRAGNLKPDTKRNYKGDKGVRHYVIIFGYTDKITNASAGLRKLPCPECPASGSTPNCTIASKSKHATSA
jgi:hypothetical protein